MKEVVRRIPVKIKIKEKRGSKEQDGGEKGEIMAGREKEEGVERRNGVEVVEGTRKEGKE